MKIELNQASLLVYCRFSKFKASVRLSLTGTSHDFTIATIFGQSKNHGCQKPAIDADVAQTPGRLMANQVQLVTAENSGGQCPLLEKSQFPIYEG